ncbi:MAG: undecaprenyl phosphate translocase family protein [Phycisphaerales bacterium]
MPNPSTDNPPHKTPDRLPLLRLLIGGAMMGLANLVPGISGGTMLVAAGVYRRFVDAVSDATRLRLSRTTILTLGLIALAAAAAIALGAAPVALGLEHARWAMYALFIGLTLGGVPALYALVTPMTPRTIAFAVLGLVVMLGVVLAQEFGAGTTSSGGGGWPMLVIAGVAGAAAMVLPGVSGAYLLLLLGQYEIVVTAIKDFVRLDVAALAVVIPVGVGVVLGIAVVSNLLRWLLHKYEKPTLAVLLGLLIGAPAGLYPFREAVPPAPGDVVKGQILTEDTVGDVEREDWPTQAFTPSALQIAGSFGLVVLGGAATLGGARLGRERGRERRGEPTAEDGN